MTDPARPPLCSIIIPSYDAAPCVAEAIESCLAQTHPHIEILVVDHGSTDNTRDLLRPYEHRITYLYQANRGLAGARDRIRCHGA